jgi:hypothetical protein
MDHTFHSGFTFQNTAAAAMLSKKTLAAVWTLIAGAAIWVFEEFGVCSIGPRVGIKGAQEMRISKARLNASKRRMRLAISSEFERVDNNAMTPP